MVHLRARHEASLKGSNPMISDIEYKRLLDIEKALLILQARTTKEKGLIGEDKSAALLKEMMETPIENDSVKENEQPQLRSQRVDLKPHRQNNSKAS